MVGVVQYENRTCNAVARVHRRPRGLPPIRRRHTADPLRFARHVHAARARLSQEGGSKSESARAETEGQAFRFPRPCRLERRRLCFLGFGLAGQLLVGRAPAEDTAHIEALRIVQAAAALLVQVRSIWIFCSKVDSSICKRLFK